MNGAATITLHHIMLSKGKIIKTSESLEIVIVLLLALYSVPRFVGGQ
jgi:hypothetical protein